MCSLIKGSFPEETEINCELQSANGKISDKEWRGQDPLHLCEPQSVKGENEK